MYLFKLCTYLDVDPGDIIYIPLCIYLNTYQFRNQQLRLSIYIPLCIYLNTQSLVFVARNKNIYIPLCIYLNVLARNTFGHWENLHSTMYLFKLGARKELNDLLYLFTFHYVSI